MRRIFKIPDVYTERFASALRRHGLELGSGRALADAVLRLSNHYITQPDAPTPYHEAWALKAYLAYFLPLNFLRARAVIEQGQRLGFFAGLTDYTDFGSGIGTLSLALEAEIPHLTMRGTCIERSPAAISVHRDLAGSGAKISWQDRANAKVEHPKTHLATFSYSLTEIAALPNWAKQCEALLVIEPATHQDSRKLLALRKTLIADGYRIWAPCTHQLACPLLEQSKRDWCHDRIAWEMPEWFSAMETHLPIKNQTLTFSYLLARRTPPPSELAQLARLTGDLRHEKGASRQMVCRGSEREFLSWQHRHGEAPVWARGELVNLSPSAMKKGNEVRPSAAECSLMDQDF